MITVHDDIEFTIVIDTEDSLKSFRKLIQRGANLWPDAPYEIKEAADLITNGYILQDYKTQTKSPGDRPRFNFAHLCSCGWTTTIQSTIVPVRVRCSNPKGCKNHDIYKGYYHEYL